MILLSNNGTSDTHDCFKVATSFSAITVILKIVLNFILFIIERSDITTFVGKSQNNNQVLNQRTDETTFFLRSQDNPIVDLGLGSTRKAYY